ncbi:phosphomannomutase/phosphoglucomutase [Abyssibius alkaniclasticus]|uniref:phosphomannomutase/phosphoglucomutase n=1 Tax=Abyssibius alkaniclasticus TaxID=2881234 RepID=UPI0023642A66|nr:phosphomannomutase/phosphoglucomutase [Abyssibius alkaniclasticus]UPH71141.1 phosphomannomutase/phosphoglucomutase [Abyssibius alkaniclasticus]
MPKPAEMIDPLSFAFLRDPQIAAKGFREYDARWRYPQEINLPGLAALGLAFGTHLHETGKVPSVAIANDYRAYGAEVKHAFTLGLLQAGCTVHDIGVALTPMAYFAQIRLGTSAVAMITASHNPNGWTGVKMGFEAPLTHGPEDMARLREICLGGEGIARSGGVLHRVDGVQDAYIDEITQGFRLARKLRVVCACGNGTPSGFAPDMLRRIGAEVVERHCTPDHSFPHYNPNPESLTMLHDMAAALTESRADLALGFDGDGDRCGVVDDRGQEIYADKLALMLARHYAPNHRGATFVVDVKTTGLFASDPLLAEHGITTDYWKTGHSHIKRRLHALGGLAGFEKSGHFFFAPPLGQGYDCGLRAALEVLKMLDAQPEMQLSDIYATLPRSFTTPTLSPFCSDETKYKAVESFLAALQAHKAAGGTLGGLKIESINTVNGARAMLAGGGFALVRASSNTPNLVVVCESTQSDANLRAILADLDAILRRDPQIGPYDQTF